MKSQIVKFKDEKESRSMRWLQSACNKPSHKYDYDNRAIHVENGKSVATNGYQLYIAPAPEVLKDQEDKNLIPQSRIKAKPSPIELVESEDTFPDWKRIMSELEEQDITFEIAVAKQHLAGLKDMPTGDSDCVILKFSDNQHAFIVEPPTIEKEAAGHKAVIMPAKTADTANNREE